MRLALGLVIKALTDYSDYSYHPESQSVGKNRAWQSSTQVQYSFRINKFHHFFSVKDWNISQLRKIWDLGNTYSLFAFVSFPFLVLTWLDFAGFGWAHLEKLKFVFPELYCKTQALLPKNQHHFLSKWRVVNSMTNLKTITIHILVKHLTSPLSTNMSIHHVLATIEWKILR